MAIGGVDIRGGKVEKYEITFTLNPSNTELTVKDLKGKVMQGANNVYKLKAGIYTYSASAENFKPIEDQRFEVYQNDTVVVNLQSFIYGVKRQISSSLTTWTRIENSIGLYAEATHDGNSVRNDFDNIYPWSNIKSCDLSKTGVVNTYIEDSGYNSKSPKGYIMTEFPEFWWGRTQPGDGWEYIYISRFETDLTPNLSKKFYLGRYKAGGTTSALSSKSGVSPLRYQSFDDLRTAVEGISTNWYQLDIWRWSAIQMLYLVEYADYNSQKMLGNGIVSSSTSDLINTGNCDSLKMKSGCLGDDKTQGVIYRGVENPWGNIPQFCDGINFTESQAWVCTDPTKYESDKFASPYVKLSYKCNTINGYISKIGCDSKFSSLQLPTEVKGSETNYITDYSTSYIGNRILEVGGGRLNTKAGLFLCNWNSSATTKNFNTGVRLMYIPS